MGERGAAWFFCFVSLARVFSSSCPIPSFVFEGGERASARARVRVCVRPKPLASAPPPPPAPSDTPCPPSRSRSPCPPTGTPGRRRMTPACAGEREQGMIKDGEVVGGGGGERPRARARLRGRFFFSGCDRRLAPHSQPPDTRTSGWPITFTSHSGQTGRAGGVGGSPLIGFASLLTTHLPAPPPPPPKKISPPPPPFLFSPSQPRQGAGRGPLVRPGHLLPGPGGQAVPGAVAQPAAPQHQPGEGEGRGEREEKKGGWGEGERGGRGGEGRERTGRACAPSLKRRKIFPSRRALTPALPFRSPHEPRRPGRRRRN